jgi:hypothetical protein
VFVPSFEESCSRPGSGSLKFCSFSEKFGKTVHWTPKLYVTSVRNSGSWIIWSENNPIKFFSSTSLVLCEPLPQNPTRQLSAKCDNFMSWPIFMNKISLESLNPCSQSPNKNVDIICILLSVANLHMKISSLYCSSVLLPTQIRLDQRFAKI